MGWRILVFSLIFWGIFIVNLRAATAEIILQIPALVTVKSAKLYLGAIAKIQGGTDPERQKLAQLSLGEAPRPGKERSISKKYLAFLLKQYRLSLPIRLEMPAQVQIKSQAFCLRGSTLRQKIEATIRIDKSLNKRWLDFYNLPQKIWLKPGDWQIKVAPVGRIPLIGGISFKVTLTNEKTAEKRVYNISGKLRGKAFVYQAKRGLAAKKFLNEQDFEKQERELKTGREVRGELPQKYRLTTRVPGRSYLQLTQIEPVPLVHKGARVKVIVRQRQCVISLVGIAREDGWQDNQIGIVNPDSNHLFQARVIGANLVEVNL